MVYSDDARSEGRSVPIDRIQMRLCMFLVHRRPYLKRTLGYLTQRVLGGGVLFAHGGGGGSSGKRRRAGGADAAADGADSADVSALWSQRYLEPFLSEALMHLLAWGFVFFRVLKEPQTGLLYPDIPLADTFAVVRQFAAADRHGRYKYALVPDDRSMCGGTGGSTAGASGIATEYDYFMLSEPTASGELTSQIAALIEDEMRLYALERCVLHATERQCDPYIFLTQAQQKVSAQDIAATATRQAQVPARRISDTNSAIAHAGLPVVENIISMVADYEQHRQSGAVDSPRLKHDSIAASMHALLSGTRTAHGGAAPLGSAMGGGNAMRVPQILPLADGQGVTRIETPTVRPDIDKLRRQVEDMETATMGMSRTLFSNDRAVKQDPFAEKMFIETTSVWKRTLSRLAEQVYYACFADTDAGHMLQAWLSNLFTSVRSLHKRNLAAAASRAADHAVPAGSGSRAKRKRAEAAVVVPAVAATVQTAFAGKDAWIDAHRVRVTIPGIIPFDLALHSATVGIISYEHLRRSLADSWGIPIENLPKRPKPLASLIAEDEARAAASATAAATAAATSAPNTAAGTSQATTTTPKKKAAAAAATPKKAAAAKAK
jgi:hypothetical protein